MLFGHSPEGGQLQFFFPQHPWLCSNCATGTCFPLSFSLLTSILKPRLSGMHGSCDGWVALGNPGAFHSEQVTMVKVTRG